MTKEIALTLGKVALVDDDDYEWLNQWKWNANRGREHYYAVRSSPTVNGIQKSIKMHRVILGLEYNDGLIGDHINRVTLDNRRDNLRVVDSNVNAQNHTGRTSNTSGYNGIDRSQNKWRVRIMSNHEEIHIGMFNDIHDAIEARRLGEIEYWGAER